MRQTDTVFEEWLFKSAFHLKRKNARWKKLLGRSLLTSHFGFYWQIDHNAPKFCKQFHLFHWSFTWLLMTHFREFWLGVFHNRQKKRRRELVTKKIAPIPERDDRCNVKKRRPVDLIAPTETIDGDLEPGGSVRNQRQWRGGRLIPPHREPRHPSVLLSPHFTTLTGNSDTSQSHTVACRLSFFLLCLLHPILYRDENNERNWRLV